MPLFVKRTLAGPVRDGEVVAMETSTVYFPEQWNQAQKYNWLLRFGGNGYWLEGCKCLIFLYK